MSKEYDRYLEEHRANVCKAFDSALKYFPQIFDRYFNEMKDLDPRLGKPVDILRLQINKHDESKYLSKEYSGYDRYFYGDGDKTAFDYAWVEHIHANPHHWQHWVVINGLDMFPLEMPSNYILEMLMDWWSFSFKKEKLNEIVDWYSVNRHKLLLADNTLKEVETFIYLVEKRF